jgi:hypothetical protein
MIGLNRLRTKVLITTDEVIFHAPIDQTVDPHIIQQCIIVAERRFVKPVLSKTLYNALIDKKNVLVTAGNKAELQTALNSGRSSDREPIVLVEGDYVNSDTYMTDAQQTLWKDHLHKITAECIWLVALPVNRARFTAAGVEKNNPETISENRASVTVDLNDIKHLLDKGLNERITVLIADMHEYLCDSNFPGYEKECGFNSKEAHAQKSSGVIFGLYDDDKRNGRWGIN